MTAYVSPSLGDSGCSCHELNKGNGEKNILYNKIVQTLGPFCLYIFMTLFPISNSPQLLGFSYAPYLVGC